MQGLRIEPIPDGEGVAVIVNGMPLTARRGETVHAALLAAGHHVLRKSKTGIEYRGAFCGMGVCYECLVTIDGRPNQQACMHRVEDGMEIETDEPDL